MGTHRPTTADPTHRPTTPEPTTSNPTTSNPTRRPTQRPTVSHADCPDGGMDAIGQHCSFDVRCEYDFVECCGERGASTICSCEDQTVQCMAVDRCMAPCPTPRPTKKPTE